MTATYSALSVTLDGCELQEIRLGLVTRLSVARANARIEPNGPVKARYEEQAAALQALLDKLRRPADSLSSPLPGRAQVGSVSPPADGGQPVPVEMQGSA